MENGEWKDINRYVFISKWLCAHCVPCARHRFDNLPKISYIALHIPTNGSFMHMFIAKKQDKRVKQPDDLSG